MIKDKSIELRDKAQERTEEAMARIEATANETLARVEKIATQLGRQKQTTETPEGKPTAV